MRKLLGQLMDKMFGKIQHQPGIEGSGPEGFKGGVRSVACISFTRQILHITHADIGAVMFEGFKGS